MSTTRAEEIGRETAKRLGIEPRADVFEGVTVAWEWPFALSFKNPVFGFVCGQRGTSPEECYAMLGRAVIACQEACGYDSAYAAGLAAGLEEALSVCVGENFQDEVDNGAAATGATASAANRIQQLLAKGEA